MSPRHRTTARTPRVNLHRGFDEIPVQELGYQSGPGRSNGESDFSWNRRSDELPRLNTWRLNLTALSQRHNLYFVAYEDAIHVFQPRFPDQQFGPDAALVLELPVSDMVLEGYIPYSKPHSVNNLIVGQLGEQEIVLCSCDDGDVIAYHTTVILDEIEAQNTDHNVRPLFHVNAGASAWGLAVQRKDRMIAVSANSHVVTVFAFALAQKLDSGTLDDSDEAMEDFESLQSESADSEEWEEAGTGISLNENSRRKNISFRLRGHDANIPSIAFPPTDQKDADGQNCHRLISTDIMGTTILWDIPGRQKLRVLYAYESQLDPPTYGHLGRRAGWTVLQLDRRAFAKTKHVCEAFGACKVLVCNGTFLCDISASRAQVRNAGAWNMLETSVQASPSRDDMARDEVSSSPQSDSATSSQQGHAINMDVHSLHLEAYDNDDHYLTKLYRLRDKRMQYLPLAFSANHDLDEPLGEHGQPLMILHPKAVHLLQSTELLERGPDSPIIFLDDPLQQEGSADNIEIMDRLCLSCQIPELGVVLIGSPKGRVAVLTLHQIDCPITYATAQDRLSGAVFTMRLDHLLPFHSQETAIRRQRPPSPLVGLAASPFPGASEGPSQAWRVILMYAGHQTLSYRIQRAPVSGLEEPVLL